MTIATQTIFDHLPFTATREQANALYQLEEFTAPDYTDDVFVLCGAAGTGKTSLVKAVVDHLEAQQIRYYLTAPTGRAAKVLSRKTNALAHTAHHVLYTPQTLADGRVLLTRKPVTAEPYSVYVVDEASMISDRNRTDGSFVAAKSLLFDLLDHIKQSNPRNKVILIGDRYQLAPVGEEFSPALEPGYLERTYRMSVRSAHLTEVKRQDNGSPILTMATDIRRRSDAGLALNRLDVPRLSSYSAGVTRYLNLYRPGNPDYVIMIGSSNNVVNNFNEIIRKRLGFAGSVLAIGDQVVINENWSDGTRLLMKGDTGRVVELDPTTEKRAALTFQRAVLAFTEPSGEPFTVTTCVLLDTLTSERGDIDPEDMKNLKAERMAKNATYRQTERAYADPYMGAMRLRYGHALTCHKAQGGEWIHVMLHPYQRPNDYRYAYTAVTRARETVVSWEPGWSN
ncbi:ATP-binding domain-containing protein [Nibrella viscosa]|uniref:ATP-binding domain-containing protein n=1 Tax=Nibrella viscosa TaxID=1084524 RepID=A0ABP8JYX4_9BACT